MIKVLKNPTIRRIETNSYGKIFVIEPKKSLTINDSQADLIATELCNRYEFLQDITPKGEIRVETIDIPTKNHKGRSVKKTKKVVRKAEGVKRV